ncbi:MAG: DUF3108 domain-containing protein [Candidatus Omnitrophota bacterium]
MDEKFVLDFQVNYLNLFPIGKASYAFEGAVEREGRYLYQLKMTAEDKSILSWLKPAKAMMISYLDISEMLPAYLFTEIEVDGKIKEKKGVVYYQEQGYMLSEGKRYLILPSTYEPLSLVFYLMQMDFELYKSKELNLNSNQSNYRVNLDGQSKKEYKIGNNTYSVWEVDISVRRRKGDVMRHSLEAKVYFLKWGNKNIPLLGKAFTNLGFLSFRIKNCLIGLMGNQNEF